MTKLLYYEISQFQPDNLKLLETHFNLISLPNPQYDRADILKDIEVVFAPLGFVTGSEKMDLMPSLKVIASNTTGTSHIDVVAAKTRGIEVISLENENEFLDDITPTAELTWGLMITTIRKIPAAFEFVKTGQWNRRPWGSPAMLSRMTLGIIGHGRLGKIVGAYGLAFGMNVVYYDPHPARRPSTELIKAPDLKTLLQTSDIVTLHVPLNPETEGMIDESAMKQFKKGAYLINTSRGEIVDTKALLDALNSGRLSGVGLDVFSGEFDRSFMESFKKHPLLEYARTHDNLIITPHIGGSTYDAWYLTERQTINRIIEFFDKDDPNEK